MTQQSELRQRLGYAALGASVVFFVGSLRWYAPYEILTSAVLVGVGATALIRVLPDYTQ